MGMIRVATTTEVTPVDVDAMDADDLAALVRTKNPWPDVLANLSAPAADALRTPEPDNAAVAPSGPAPAAVNAIRAPGITLCHILRLD